MAAHSSILAWRIPWTKEPGGLQPMGLQELDTTEQLNHQPYAYIYIYIYTYYTHAYSYMVVVVVCIFIYIPMSMYTHRDILIHAAP